MTVIALAASVGFTFTLFLATTLYPAGPLLAELGLGGAGDRGGLLAVRRGGALPAPRRPVHPAR